MFVRIVRTSHDVSHDARRLLLLSGCGGGGGYDGGGGGGAAASTPPTITLTAPAATRQSNGDAHGKRNGACRRHARRVPGRRHGGRHEHDRALHIRVGHLDGRGRRAHVTARVTDAANVVVTSAAGDRHREQQSDDQRRADAGRDVSASDIDCERVPATLTFNLISGAVSGGVTVAGVNATLAHIHTGYAGAAGPIIVNFVQNSADPTRWAPQAGSLLTAEQVDDLLLGKLYVNVHSAAYPQGEIRGQSQPDNIDVVITRAERRLGVAAGHDQRERRRGHDAGFNVASNATVHVNTTGVDDATEAHVHKAAAGAEQRGRADHADAGRCSRQPLVCGAATHHGRGPHGFHQQRLVRRRAHPDKSQRRACAGRSRRTRRVSRSPTLTQLQSSIFTPICSGCHNGVGAALARVDESDLRRGEFRCARERRRALEQPAVLRVAPSNPDGSYLVRKLEGASGISGARMPFGGPFLDQATIDQVRSWIGAGAQNN